MRLNHLVQFYISLIFVVTCKYPFYFTQIKKQINTMENQLNISHFKKLSVQMGAVLNGKKVDFPIALHPFTTSKRIYDSFGQLHEAWQRVLLKVASDHRFLMNLLEDLTEGNDLLRGNLEILQKMDGRPLDEGICVNRIDYYQSEDGQPKLTEYNLLCVGYQANSEILQTEKRITENDDPSYFENAVVANCTSSICELLQLKKMKGIVLYVVYMSIVDLNKYDWKAFHEEFAKRSVKAIAVNLKQMADNLTLRQNGDLYYGQERVVIVYYRSTFRLPAYKFGDEKDVERSFAAKEKVCRSNAFAIPPIQFELVNQKRVQTELSKPEVLRRYASEEDAALIMKTRVKEWEFDSMLEEELRTLISKVEANLSDYVLKPNMEGGGNNIFGVDILSVMKGDRKFLRSYILMERIKTNPQSNIIIVGQDQFTQQCQYQIGRFGTLTWTNGKIISNKTDGFLIRAKSTGVNESGISLGTGSMVCWKAEEK